MSNARKQPPGLRCPQCRGGLKVIRTSHAVGYTSRRLQCLTCGARTNSVERLIHDAPPTATAISDGQAAIAIGQVLANAKLLAGLAGLSDIVFDNSK